MVDEAAIRSSVVGLKDTGTSATQVIDRLFKKPPRRKGGSNSDDTFVNRIVRDVQTSGEYEKISQGELASLCSMGLVLMLHSPHQVASRTT